MDADVIIVGAGLAGLAAAHEQRRLGVHDSLELAWNDWQGSARLDRLDDEDAWAVRWARIYVEFAAGEKRAWLDSPARNEPVGAHALPPTPKGHETFISRTAPHQGLAPTSGPSCVQDRLRHPQP
jgi:predicted oxidoreductase